MAYALLFVASTRLQSDCPVAVTQPQSPFVAAGQRVLHRRRASPPQEAELGHLERALQSQMAQLESQREPPGVSLLSQ